jgi:hypothetical protein
VDVLARRTVVPLKAIAWRSAVVAARPLLCALSTHWEGRGGEGALEVAGSERALTPGMSRPGERWPIVLAMRNGEFYVAVVAAAINRLRRRLFRVERLSGP